MQINMAQARSLCSQPELRIVEAAKRDVLSTLSHAQLRQKATQARKLRDKWRDQAKSQRRQTQEQQRARATSANTRTEKKANLFAEVLRRFEERLERAEAPEAGQGSAAKRPSRGTRAASHRNKRAASRRSLERARARQNDARR